MKRKLYSKRGQIRQTDETKLIIGAGICILALILLAVGMMITSSFGGSIIHVK